VSNAGLSDAAAPTVTDTLPGYETPMTATGTGWTCTIAGQTVTCTAGDALLTGESEAAITLTTELAGTLPASIVNTAGVSSTTTDPATANNTSTDTTDRGAASATLAITKTHTGDFTAGTDGVYTVTVANTGPSDSPAPGPITVTDTLPVGETFVSATGTGWTCSATGTPTTVTCDIASGLVVGTSTAITLTIAIPTSQPAGTLTNRAAVTGPGSPPATASDPTTIVTSADLSIVKTHTGTFTAGQDGTYRLAVTNNGPSDSPSPGPIVVTDSLPSGETFVSAAGDRWTCRATGTRVECTSAGSFVAGTSSTITLVVALGAAAVPSVHNTASVAGTGSDPKLTNNSSTDEAAVAPGAVLALTKTLIGTTLASGAHATYHVTVDNKGPSPATGVTITDALPAGLDGVSAGGTGWTCTVTSTKVICVASEPVPDGTVSSFDVVALVTATSGSVTNHVSAAALTTILNPGGAAASSLAIPVVGRPPTSPPKAPLTVPVQPTVDRPQGVLAWTGTDVERWIGLALAFGILGFALLLAARRPRRKSRK
jgi:uncharacterized repeat protein (TIGR01451 family)